MMFPGAQGVKQEHNCSLAPVTTRLLESIPSFMSGRYGLCMNCSSAFLLCLLLVSFFFFRKTFSNNTLGVCAAASVTRILAYSNLARTSTHTVGRPTSSYDVTSGSRHRPIAPSASQRKHEAGSRAKYASVSLFFLHLARSNTYQRDGRFLCLFAGGQCIVFDDSFDHEVAHRGDRDRVVLLIDVRRQCPRGRVLASDPVVRAGVRVAHDRCGTPISPRSNGPPSAAS
jgi:hypothetical protein